MPPPPFLHPQQTQTAPLHTVLRRCWGGVLGMADFSAAANVLLLVAPVYLLQIYDRVLPGCEPCHPDRPDGRGCVPVELFRAAGLGAPAVDADSPREAEYGVGIPVVLRGVGAPHAAPLRSSAGEKRGKGQGEHLPRM